MNREALRFKNDASGFSEHNQPQLSAGDYVIFAKLQSKDSVRAAHSNSLNSVCFAELKQRESLNSTSKKVD